jgi:release factor glutamine methyltransferase
VPSPTTEDETIATITIDPTTTRAAALALLRSAFTEAGIDGPDLDARLLLMEALQVDAVEIAARPQMPLGDRAVRLAGLARRRLAREPVGRILGRREFWGLSFELSPETLEPRPDSETVVETALSLAPDRLGGLTVLDLGTGSGCLLVALLQELPQAIGFGVDRSSGALASARRNAWRNGVGDRAAFVASDWTSALQGRFDLIVCNPPYIPSSDIASLAPEVREHDPAPALDGGEDGFAAYCIIFAKAADLLASGGSFVVEIGSTQEGAVRRLAHAAGLEVVRVTQDLSGHSRAVGLVPHRGTPI